MQHFNAIKNTITNGTHAKFDGSEMGSYARTILKNKRYVHEKHSGHHEEWREACDRVVDSVMQPYMSTSVCNKTLAYMYERKFIPGGRYLYASGRKYHQINSCFLFSCMDDTKEEWGRVMDNSVVSLMTGGGVGVVYSKLRCKESVIKGMGGSSSGPCALMKMINESGRYIFQGGSRRSALWAGLHWNHADIEEFICMKDWTEDVKYCKSRDFNFPAPMDGTNISVILNTEFFEAYDDPTHPKHKIAHKVYWMAIRHMLETGEPGFSIDTGENENHNLRNACTELNSDDDLDCCNLGSINLGRIGTIEEFMDVIEASVAFLICGTLYSKLPVEGMYRIRQKNRRLGLGLMGIHEWLLKRGYSYEANSEIAKWLEAYALSGEVANKISDGMGISRPVATRAIAPNGTISIIGETTGGIEPIMAVAYKRRYLEGTTWRAQYVVDPVAHRLINDSGINPDDVQDAYSLSEDVGRRIEFQRFVQQYVDHGIASTINLPEWGSSLNNSSTVENFGNTLYPQLPGLRGITVYPNNARSGQPFVRSTYREAIRRSGIQFDDGGSNVSNGDSEQGRLEIEKLTQLHDSMTCKDGVCGI